jgi:hypothetical protein
MKAWCGGAAAMLLAVVIPGAASAAPKEMCPGGESGWEEGTVRDAADEIWAGLLDTSPWPGGVDDLAAEIQGRYDRNDNGQVCVATRWGTRPAEQGHWYGVTYFLVRDDNSNG